MLVAVASSQELPSPAVPPAASGPAGIRKAQGLLLQSSFLRKAGQFLLPVSATSSAGGGLATAQVCSPQPKAQEADHFPMGGQDKVWEKGLWEGVAVPGTKGGHLDSSWDLSWPLGVGRFRPTGWVKKTVLVFTVLPLLFCPLPAPVPLTHIITHLFPSSPTTSPQVQKK